MTPAERLQTAQKRVKALTEAKIGAQKEYEVLKRQYDEKVAGLKAQGIDNVEDLPEKIAELENQLAVQLADVERQLTETEAKL